MLELMLTQTEKKGYKKSPIVGAFGSKTTFVTSSGFKPETS